ncbi:MAG: anthranilate phosphoribosyltransferase [Granulosicoccus sp.]
MNKSISSDDIQVADAKLIRSVIQRVATGPELSKNISYDEARAMMHALLDQSIDPVQAGVFLIGLRMKRETEDEVRGILDALRDKTIQATASVSDVVVISDPYNGFNRSLPGSLFVLPVLAACGVSAYSHGVETVGPKFGVTHHTTIKALGGNPVRSVEETSNQLSDPDIGWGYIDQSKFCPSLHSLNELRTLIVKRPVLTTTEVMIGPITGTSGTHLVTGYVHKPYRDVYTTLARHIGYESLLLVRGTEGGVIPSFAKPAHVVRYWHDEPSEELDHNLAECALERSYRAANIPDDVPEADGKHIGMKWNLDALSRACADGGLAALGGEAGPLQDAAVLGTALILLHLGRAKDMGEAANQAREAINSGEALHRLKAGL